MTERILIFGITYPVNLNGAGRTENGDGFPQSNESHSYKNRIFSVHFRVNMYRIFNC